MGYLGLLIVLVGFSKVFEEFRGLGGVVRFLFGVVGFRVFL